jgi:O-antigen/teichoic acid export membrane protein
VLGAVLVAVAVAGPFLRDELMSGEGLLIVAWMLSLAGTACGHLLRGVFAGQARFGPYARFIGGEATARFLGCAVLAVVGVETVGPYGLVFGLAPFVAVAFALQGQRDVLVPGPPASMTETSSAIAPLLAGSLLSMALVNAGPIAVEVLAKATEEDEAGRFLACLVVARVPLFLFQAVQAALLPRLSALASAGRAEELRRGLGRLLVMLGGLALAGLIVAAAIGPPVVSLLFGGDFDLGRRTMTLLAVGSGAYMVASAAAQANIALHGHRRMAMAWGLSVASFLVTVAVASDELFLRVEMATVVGGVVALAAHLAVLRGLLRSGVLIDPGDLVEALTDVSLEP